MVQTEVMGLLRAQCGWGGSPGGKQAKAHPLPRVLPQAQYVFLHQCILRFLQQPDQALTENGAAYENPLYKNI